MPQRELKRLSKCHLSKSDFMYLQDGTQVFRGVADCDFVSQAGDVKKGDVCGYFSKAAFAKLDKSVPKKGELSWWTDIDAVLTSEGHGNKGCISDSAYVENSHIMDHAVVDGSCFIKDSEISDNAHVGGNAHVYHCDVLGNASLIGSSSAEYENIDSGEYSNGDIVVSVSRANEQIERANSDFDAGSVMDDAMSDVLYTRDENGDNPYERRPLPVLPSNEFDDFEDDGFLY